jgi:hypothetical protein
LVPRIPPPKGGNRDQCGDFGGSEMKAHHEPIALTQLQGKDIPGGCADCTAFQRLVKEEDGIWVLTTFHDNTCPFLLARKAN